MAGKIYFKGLGIKKSIPKAIKHLSKSALNGDLESQKWLGIYFKTKILLIIPAEKAIYWLSLAVKQGSRGALILLGEIYNDLKMFDKALYCYLEAAKKGLREAVFRVGLMLLNNKGYKGSTKKDGIAWLEEAAYLNHIKSQKMLVDLFEKEKNLEKAFEYLLLSAEIGDLYSQKKIAHMYRHGEGVEKSAEKGFMWSEKAALQGDSESVYNIGFLTEKGFGTIKSEALAIEKYEAAIKMDPPPPLAYYRLGMIRYKNKEYDLSFNLFLNAKKHDPHLVPNNYMLGVSYEKSQGTSKNINQALVYFDMVINCENKQDHEDNVIQRAQNEIIIIKKNASHEDYIEALTKAANEGSMKHQVN